MAHLTDAELLQLADQELPPEHSAELELHLAHCSKCASRQCILVAQLNDFVQARQAELDPKIPSAGHSEQRLRARLAAPAPAPHRPPLWAFPTIAAALVLAGLWWLPRNPEPPVKPDSRLTPGAALALSREQVCAVPDQDELRIVPVALAGQVFHNYGLRPTPRRYEVDYLIAPDLGGATDVRNLWPQPYAGGVWNAGVKDALENQLRRLVCAGQIDLPTAQHDIAADWIAAYRKYFQTDLPLAAHATYRKDRPWE